MLNNFHKKSLFSIFLSFALSGCSALIPDHSSTGELNGSDSSRYESLPGNKALSVSSNGIIGISSYKFSVKSAVDEAIASCEKLGGVGCKVVDINNIKAFGNFDYLNDSRLASYDDVKISQGRFKCSELSRTLALKLLNSGHSYLDSDNDGVPCEYEYSTFSDSPQVTSSGSNCHYVSGYRRKNGTYVRGYMRCR